MEQTRRRQLRNEAVFSLCVIPLIGMKYLLLNRLGLLDRFHNANALISYFFVIPLLFAGVYYSLGVLVDTYREKREKTVIFADFNVMMSLPVLFFLGYLMVCLFGA